MAYRVVNGSGSPTIHILQGYTTTTFNLPFCKRMTEIWTERKILHEVISPDINNPVIKRVKETLGWHVQFMLDYADYVVVKSDILNIATILNATSRTRAETQILLVPRNDYPNGFFKVLYTSENFTLDIAKGGTNAPGNKSIILQFETVDLQPTLKLFDPDAVAVFANINNQNIFYAKFV